MKLPHNLIEFLQNAPHHDMPFEKCVTGKLDFLQLEQLKVELFPTDMDNGPLDNSGDPHYRELGCYLIPAVNLVADCDNFDAEGLILWLPDENCFGTWDSSHTLVEVFPPSISWSDITSDPIKYINSFWGEDNSHGVTPLIPWPKYQYSTTQQYSPLPIEQE